MTSAQKKLIPSCQVGSGHVVVERRRSGLLDAPAVVQRRCYFYTVEQVEEMHRRTSIGLDELMFNTPSPKRGRPSIARIGAAYRAAAAAGRG